MPPTLDIKTRLVFTGPQNVKPVVDDLRRKFGNINVPIKVTIDSRSSAGITNLNKRLSELTANLKTSRRAADDLSYSLIKLGASFKQVGGSKQNITTIQKTEQAISKVRDSAKASGSELEKFGQSAAFAIRRFSAFTVAVGAVFGFVRALQTAVSEAIDFEKQLTKIAQVQGSRAGVKALSDEITRLSTTLGVSSKELVGITDVLVQAGITGNQTKKALSALAKTQLAPTFNDIKNTTEAAIAAMAQFKLEASDLESVFGSINAVAAAFATEAEDLTTVIRKTGAVFASAGSQLDDPKKQLNELLALFTAVRSTTRESADTIATGFRTIFSRLQRPDTIQFLRNFNIELSDSEGKFVGVFEAVRRLNSGLSQFQSGDLQFAEIIKQLAGRGEQISKVIPLIKEFPKALDALNTANKGTNSLTRDQILAQETLANSISRVREEFLALIRGITETDSFKIMTKSILGLASALISVAETLKPVLPLITALAAVKLASGGFQFAKGFAGELHLGGGKKIPGKASGGFVPGSGNSDSVLSALTPGEFIIPKGAAQKLGPKLLGRLQKFAKGGLVGGSGGGGTGRIAIGGQFDTFEFDVKGAAAAITGFTKAITDSALAIKSQELAGSPTATAINGGLHPDRLESFPLSPVSGIRRLQRVSTETQVPLIGPPITGIHGPSAKPDPLFSRIGQSRNHNFRPAILSDDHALPKLAEDRIPFDSVVDKPGPNLNRLGRGKFSPLGFNTLAAQKGQKQSLGIKTSFGVGNSGFGPGQLGSTSGLGDTVDLLNQSKAVFAKLPASLKHYTDALTLIASELEKGVPTEKARNVVGKKLLARSIRELHFDDHTQGATKDLRSNAALRGIAGPIPEAVARKLGLPVGPDSDIGPGRPKSLFSRAATGLRGISASISGANLSPEEQAIRGQRVSNITHAAGFAGLLAAGQLENGGRTSKAAASGISGGIAVGGLVASAAGGPVGAIVGVTVGVVAALNRFQEETKRLAIEAEQIKFDKAAEEIKKLISGDKPQTQIDKVGENALKIAQDQAKLENPTKPGFFAGAAGAIGDVFSLRAEGSSAAKFEKEANDKITASVKAKAEEIANPQFTKLKNRISSGSPLASLGITGSQKDLFKTAGLDLSELINIDKIRVGQQALAKLTSNIELLGTKFERLAAVTEADITIIERFTKEQEELSNAFSGGRLTGASSKASSVFSNVQGFSSKSVSGALSSVGADARTSSIINSGKKALENAPGIFQGINASASPGQIKADLAKGIQGLKLDKAIEDTILHDIRELDITGDGEQEFREKFKELGENLTQNINKILDPAVKSAQALAKKQEAAANLYIEGLNRLAEAQTNLRSTVFDSSDTKLDATRSIASAEGRNLTSGEERSALNAKTAALGIGSPTGLGGRIAGLRARGAALVTGRNATTPGSAEFKDFTDKLAANNDELDKAQKALELFAKDTTLAGIAADKLQKAEAKRAVGREIAGGILGGDKLGFAKKINALGRFNAGDNRVLSTSFEDVQSGVDLQNRFLRANGRGKEADAVEQNFDKRLGEVLGPEMAKFFKSVRDEENKAKADQIAAAKLQITAAEESIKASAAAVEFYKGRVGGGRARGGMIRGSGTSTSDSIPARLSDGEYVVNAAAVRNIGVDTLDDMNATGFARGGIARNTARNLIRTTGFNRGLGHRRIVRGTKGLSPFNAARFDLRTAYQSARKARGASFRRGRRGFASGGLVEGGSGGIAISGLNSFAAAANNLANALNSVNIPSAITMTGTHQVNVTLNGAAVLQDLLNGPIGGLIRSEIDKAMSKYDRDLKS